MNCMFAEVYIDGQWHKVGREFVSTYEELEGQLTDRVYDKRDRHLAAFLTDQGAFTGMPLDASQEIKNHSVFKDDAAVYCITLRKLLDFKWDKEFYETGYISEWQYKNLKNNALKPVNIVKHPYRLGNLVVSPFYMDMVLSGFILREEGKYYIEYQYNKSTARETFKFFCETSIPGLLKLIPKGGSTNDVRVIYSA